MQIHREKFLALTATLAGFWPSTACTLVIGDSSSATNGATTSQTTEPGTGTTAGTGGMTAGSTGGTAATTTTTGSLTFGPTGGTTMVPQYECCEVNVFPGCLNDAIEACVCAEDPYCCGLEGGVWDLTCVNQVNTFGCGVCEVGGTSGGSSTFG